MLGSLAGFVVLAGVSYHQVRNDGADPGDQAIMTGTAVNRTAERTDRCAQADAGREGASARAASDCGDAPRR